MSETSAVRPHLERRFETRRVVFWHDPDGEYAADLDALGLEGVEIVRVANDEYAVRNRLLHLEPEAKFLVYRSGAMPTGVGNWLLDLELAYGVFTATRPRSCSGNSGSPPTASVKSSRRTRSSSGRPSGCELQGIARRRR